jgi:hypothetical protein
MANRKDLIYSQWLQHSPKTICFLTISDDQMTIENFLLANFIENNKKKVKKEPLLSQAQALQLPIKRKLLDSHLTTEEGPKPKKKLVSNFLFEKKS